MRRWQIIAALVAAAWVLLGRGAAVPDAAPASCAELADVMLHLAQDDLSSIELWPPEDQAALFADDNAFNRWADLVRIHSVSTRMGDRTCGAVALGAAWCDRIRGLVAGSDFGRAVRSRMIAAQCGAP
jgi:hypothetical protein